MSFSFRPAKRENVGLLIGIAGASGSGKTFSSLRLATGLAGGHPFCVIDTESGRARHYADLFKFDHGDLGPPFRPERYAEAIGAAVVAGYSVIVVDSISHEHAGEGGLLDWQEEELTRMAGEDWKRREAVKMAAWVKPKMAHKKMVQKLLTLPAHVHLILAMRAEEKIEMVRGADGKMEIRPKATLTGLSGWVPICEKTLPYELTASFLLTPDKPGVPKPIKLQEQHRPFFPADQPITERSGGLLGEWARGGQSHEATTEQPTGETGVKSAAPSTGEGGGKETGSAMPPNSVSPERGASSEQNEREALMAKITAHANMLGMKASKRAELWATHCGQGADPRTVDVAALTALLEAMR